MYDNLILLRDIVDNTPLPIAVYIGVDLKIELANPAMIKTWGKGSQVIGRKYLDIVPEIKEQQIYDQALRVFKTGIPFHAVDQKVDLVINGSNQTHYFNYSFIPLLDAQGRIYGVMNTGTEVTDLHQARQQLENASEKLKMAVDSSGIGTYEIDLATREILTSGNFNAIWSVDTEITEEQLISKLHPLDQTAREKAHAQSQLTDKLRYEARIINADNSFKWVRINGKIIKNENNEPVTLIGIVQDIDEQKHFEQELKKQVQQSTKELIRSNDDLLHFASVVSHDLREPVRKIEIFSGLLANETAPGLAQKPRRHIERINQSAKRMNGLIEGILAYSTVDKKTQSVEVINLNEMIENIKTDLELIIKEKGAILITNELPAIEGAPILIQQLFYNLIQNALKFSKADLPPRVTILSAILNEQGRDFIQITISDNGIGLDPVFAERIFGVFERLHSKDQYEGNGLGLALCRKIALRHNGSITASGAENVGADFIVTLPLKQHTENI